MSKLNLVIENRALSNTVRIVKVPRASPTRSPDRLMIILGYCYRFASNFMLLALVYFTLNLLERYEQRTLVAVLVIIYASMRIALVLRSFHFRSCLERLEAEARRLATPVTQSTGAKS